MEDGGSLGAGCLNRRMEAPPQEPQDGGYRRSSELTAGGWRPSEMGIR